MKIDEEIIKIYRERQYDCAICKYDGMGGCNHPKINLEKDLDEIIDDGCPYLEFNYEITQIINVINKIKREYYNDLLAAADNIQDSVNFLRDRKL